MTEGRNADVVGFCQQHSGQRSTHRKATSLPGIRIQRHYVNGVVHASGSSAFEKRGIAVNVPVWNPDNCIQCNFCSYVCPHAVIRPVVMTEEEAAAAPEGMKMAADDRYARICNSAMTISVLDCTGCGSCANVCPGKKGEKALAMQRSGNPIRDSRNYFDYGFRLPVRSRKLLTKFKETTVKGSQFKQPLLEFSGACAGCGETPYAKLADTAVTATECTLPMLPAVPLSGVTPHRLLLTP